MSSVGYAQGRRAREAAAKERRKKLLALGGARPAPGRARDPGAADARHADGPMAPARRARPLRRASTSAAVACRQGVAAARASCARPRSAIPSPRAGSPTGSPLRPRSARRLRDPFQQPSALRRRRGARTAAPAAHHRRHARARAPRVGYTVVLASIPTSSGRASGGAVRPHGPRARRRRRRRASVVDPQPAARRLLGRVQRHVPQRRRVSAPPRRSTRGATRPPTSGSSSGTRSTGRDHLDSRA